MNARCYYGGKYHHFSRFLVLRIPNTNPKPNTKRNPNPNHNLSGIYHRSSVLVPHCCSKWLYLPPH